MSYYDGQFQVYVLAPSGNLYQDIYSPGGTWSGWQSDAGLSFTGGNGVTAMISGDGLTPRVYGVAGSGNVYQGYFDGSWHGQNLGGTGAGTPAATLYADGNYNVFVQAPSGSLWRDTYTSSGWTGWNLIANAV